MSFFWKCVVVASVGVGATTAFAADPAALAKRLHNAADASSLDDPALKPWHLKLSVQLFDEKGAPSEQGTIEEWWTPDADKRVYDTPSYKATEIRNGKLRYRTAGLPTVPSALEAARERVVHPMATAEEIDGAKPEQKVENFGVVKLDCIMLDKQLLHLDHPPIGLYPTYCLDEKRDLLRVSYKFGSELSAFNKVGTFQGRTVAIDVEISINNVKAVTAHVTALEGRTIDAALFVPGSDLEEPNAGLVRVGAGVIAGQIVSRVQPVYPQDAKEQHISGAVILRAVIGTDGRVHQLTVVSGSAPSLALSALAAVRRWVYRPYLLNGVPVEVDTEITVHYNFG